MELGSSEVPVLAHGAEHLETGFEGPEVGWAADGEEAGHGEDQGQGE